MKRRCLKKEFVSLLMAIVLVLCLVTPNQVLANNNDTTEQNVMETDAGDTTVKVEGNIPEEVELSAETLPVSEEEAVFKIDITLNEQDGTEWQPEEDNVEVTLDADALGLVDGTRIKIVHEHEGNTSELGEYTVEDGDLVFETDGFSVFYGYTVDFSYGEYEYSIKGGSSIYLADLFEALGIEQSVSDVANVEFTNPALLEVAYDEEAKDWKLKSLESFTSEEKLTVTFQNGGELIIDVTDEITGTITLTAANVGNFKSGITVLEGQSATIDLNGQTLETQYIDVYGTLTIKGSGTLRQTKGYGNGTYQDWYFIEVYADGKLNIEGTSSDRIRIEEINGNRTRSGIACSGIMDLKYVDIDGFKALNTARAHQHQGGAIFVKESQSVDIDLYQCCIQNCSSYAGSAIMLRTSCSGTLDVTETVIQNCYTKYRMADGIDSGGAVRTNGSVSVRATFEDCIFRNNTDERNGAAIYWNANGKDSAGNKAHLYITNCQFLGNKAEDHGAEAYGGAIFLEGNSTIAGEGAVSVEDAITDTSARVPEDGLTGTLFYNNSATNGGGAIMIYSYNGGESGYDSAGQSSLTMGENILITDNHTDGNGGGVGMYVSWTKDVSDGFDYILNIDGTEIVNNSAKVNGGGVYLENAYQSYDTFLELKSGSISNNTAANGGGVYVENVDVKFGANTAGVDVCDNVASGNGGGIYQTGSVSDCTVKGEGYISNNTAANGGGFYIAEGTMDVSGGHVLFNKAVGTPGKTDAYASGTNKGVGGGIYVHEGSFSMVPAGATVGIYGNEADFAADDVYASPADTTIAIPSVDNMILTDKDGNTYGRVDDWFEDYAAADSKYESGLKQGDYKNSSAEIYRYDDADNAHKITNKVLNASDKYVCLTLGYQIDVIDLDIIKLVEGNLGDRNKKFAFTVVVTPAEEDKDEYSVETYTFDLAHGGEKTIENVPVDATVTVSEVSDGYTSSAKMYKFDATSETQKKVVELTASDKDTYSFVASIDDLAVEVTNAKNGDIDTGVLPDTPNHSIVLLGIVAVMLMAGGVMYFNKRRIKW